MDALALLHQAKEAGLRVEPVAALCNTADDAELLAPSPWFERVVMPAVGGEPSLEMPCASRRGRVDVRQDGLLLHFCAKCGAWGAFGYGVNLRAGRQGRWYCGRHRRPARG
jgi:hypothetical protein